MLSRLEEREDEKSTRKRVTMNQGRRKKTYENARDNFGKSGTKSERHIFIFFSFHFSP
jgi:hypothetical protein